MQIQLIYKACDGKTVLYIAARDIFFEAVKQLLDIYRIDPNGMDCNGESALMNASKAKYILITKLLLDGGADPTMANTALLITAKNGSLELLYVLLRHGDKVDLASSKGTAALHLAAKQGNMQMTKLLIKAGASPAFTWKGKLPPILQMSMEVNNVYGFLMLLYK